jgi:hypothetical protein
MRFELVVVALLPLAAMAEPVTPAEDGVAAPQVAVIRGSQAPILSRHEQGVIVMRPERGSLMRETTRLAAEAEAREERAARQEAREVNLRLASALLALQVSAAAAQRRPHRHDWLIFTPAISRGAHGRMAPKLRPVPTRTPLTP